MGGLSCRLQSSVIDWAWSTAFYSAALVAVAGAIGMIWPLRSIHRKSRLRAFVMALGGVVTVVGIALITPSPQSFVGPTTGIDDYMPQYHFREHHTIAVSASPDRVYAAIKSVSADEIALFRLFTGIRRFGRPGPESILNAPAKQPILDVATRTGFLLLIDRAPSDIVLGAVVVAPPGIGGPRRQFTGADFMGLIQPGFAKATMNFRIQELGNGTSRVDTETRVFATDGVALKRFTPYWRVILPGSSILRATWLRAIKTKAEKASS
ncbi:MAG TPA: hypothetical protein VM096_10915 [Vicinamibacterales bacterium]|nr:hypothetical protein [Vicinamibacterales bacterium]